MMKVIAWLQILDVLVNIYSKAGNIIKDWFKDTPKNIRRAHRRIRRRMHRCAQRRMDHRMEPVRCRE